MSPATKKVEDFSYLRNYGAIRGKSRQPYLLVRLDGHRTSSLNPSNQQPLPKLPIFATLGARASRPHGLQVLHGSPKIFALRPVALSWVFTPLEIVSIFASQENSKANEMDLLKNGELVGSKVVS